LGGWGREAKKGGRSPPQKKWYNVIREEGLAGRIKGKEKNPRVDDSKRHFALCIRFKKEIRGREISFMFKKISRLTRERGHKKKKSRRNKEGGVSGKEGQKTGSGLSF